MDRQLPCASSKSPRFTILDEHLRDIFSNILSGSSIGTYKTAFVHYKNFAKEHSLEFQMPISTSELVLFIAYMRSKAFVASTISTYVSAIGFVHKMNQWPDPTITFIIEKVLKIIHKTTNADMRLPITSTVLYKIVSALKHTVSTRYEQILFRAMFTLAYHALLRVGEMTVNNNKHEHVLQLSQITLSHDTIVVYFFQTFSWEKFSTSNCKKQKCRYMCG